MTITQNVESLIARGREHVAGLRFDEAREAFEAALALESGCVLAQVELARLHVVRGDRAAAERHLVEAEARVVGASALEAGAVLATRGLLALTAGDHVTASRALREALTLAPDDRMSHVNLAACKRASGDLVGAEASLRRALQIDPEAFTAHFDLAGILARTGRAEEAIRELLNTLRLNPLHMKSTLALGALYKLGGRGEIAMKLYAEGLRHNPNAHPLREELRDLHGLRLELPDALRHAAELVRRRRKPSDLLALGKLAVAAGEIDRARTAFELARELAPESWEPHYNLAEVQRLAGFQNEAYEGYLRAVEFAQDDWRPYNGLGLARLERAGEGELARDLLAKATELAPQRPEPRFNLALALAKLGDRAAARREAHVARELAVDGDTYQTQADELLAAI